MLAFTLDEIQRRLVRDGSKIFEVYSRADTGDCVVLTQHTMSRHYYVSAYGRDGVLQEREFETSLDSARAIFAHYVAGMRDF